MIANDYLSASNIYMILDCMYSDDRAPSDDKIDNLFLLKVFRLAIIHTRLQVQ